MTRDELIEKVARSILYERFFIPDMHNYKDEKEFWEDLDEDHMQDAKSEATAAINTIYEALKEPTPQMQIVVSKNWGRRTWEEYKEVINASPLNKGE